MLYYKTYQHKNKADKPWLTFVHGAGGSSSIWFPQIRFFKAHFNLLFVDLRGHGKSESLGTKATYDFDEISDDVVEILDFLEIKKTHLLGISLGTIVIMNIAHRYSSKVISLVMGGAVMYLNTRAQILMKLGVLSKRIIPYLWLYQFFAYIIMPKKNHKPSRMFFVNEAKKMNQKEFINWFSLVAVVNKTLLHYRTKEIEQKVLYVMGEQDYMFLPSVKKIVNNHKNSSLKIIETCGHVVNIEQAAVFNSEVLSFINS